MKALIKEERWVPVTESGHRWVGRSKAEAEEAMRDVPVGGLWLTGEPWDGITHLEHEVRYVTEWSVVGTQVDNQRDEVTE